MDFSVFTAFIAAHREWALVLIFLVSFAESFAFVSLLVPGTTILAACGTLLPGGTLDLWTLMGGAIPGAVVGDGISYWLGKRYGATLLQRWPFRKHPELVTNGEAFLRRYGMASVAVGRFFGPVRAVIPLVAGMARMPARAFWLANVGSAFVWAPVVVLPGALLGWAAEQADEREYWIMAAVAAALGVVALVVVRRRRAAGAARGG